MNTELLAPRPPMPSTWMLHHLRPAFQRGIKTWWDISIHGADNVPTSGPVILASNHIGWLDGPFLAILPPRPAHVLTKREMFKGGLGTFLRKSGQIALTRQGVDTAAIAEALTVLDHGACVGIFPEGFRGAGEVRRARGGAAYLALVTGAPIVPVVFLGTRDPGTTKGQIPRRGSTMSVTFGKPLQLTKKPWPRRKQDIETASEQVRLALRDTIESARHRTGMELPGPLAGIEETS